MAGRNDRNEPRWVWAVAIVVGLLLLVGVLSGDEDGSDSDAAAVEQVQTARDDQDTQTTTTETTPAEPVQTIQDAQVLVDDDEYSEALAVAAAIGAEQTVRRRIANRLARRVHAALDAGDRQRASYLLSAADRYPTTSSLRQARRSYRTAKVRAAQRAAARRAAAERRRAQARARRQAEREAATPDTPSVPPGGTCADTPATDFPVPPGDPRDRDGDGIACES